jgi:hypothetical protein
VARRLRVSLTYADHTDAARAVPLHAAALDAELWDAARRAFTQANARRLAIRGVALTLDRLEEAEAQLELWDQRADRQAAERAEAHADARAADDGPRTAARGPALQDAIDRIRGRWGTRGVVRGAGLAVSASCPSTWTTSASTTSRDPY